MQVKQLMDIVLIEPWFAKFGHVPFNRSFANVIHEAFPDTRISFACTQHYRRELEGKENSLPWINWIENDSWPHPAHSAGEFWNRTRWLIALNRKLRQSNISPALIIVLGGSGPILLATFAARFLSFPAHCKTYVVMHAVNDIFLGWRPRNPLRRLFSFRTSFNLISSLGLDAIALEPYIADELRKAFPRHLESIHCIPHPCDESESLSPRQSPEANSPLRIVFVGQATPNKGFAEFVRFAELAQSSKQIRVEFLAAGALRNDVRNIDQSALARKAGEQPLERSELLDVLATADLVFSWHSDYYEFSPSGVLMDCIGLEIPLTGRRSRAIKEIEKKYGEIGLFAENVDALLRALSQISSGAELHTKIGQWKNNLRKARIDRCTPELARLARQEIKIG